MYSKVCKMSVKEQFIENAKDGKVLTHKCTSCGHLHLSTVYYCEKCGSKGFEDAIFDGVGSIATYTIITVAPAGFDKYTPYAFVILQLDNVDLRISGFMGELQLLQIYQLELEPKLLALMNAELLLKNSKKIYLNY